MATGSFYVSASGKVTGHDENQNSIFAKQLVHIREALDFGRRHNNILVDLRFNSVSLVVPSKHTYEVIYNRLGNDLILWKPSYFKVKEYLFKQVTSLVRR